MQQSTSRGAGTRYSNRGGTRRLVVASAQPILALDGRMLGAVVAIHDITDRKVAEQRLHESEAQLSAYFNALRQAWEWWTRSCGI